MNKTAALFSTLVLLLSILCGGNGQTLDTRNSVERAEYYVDNQTSKSLIPTAKPLGTAPISFLVKSIPPKSKVHIYTFAEGTGGHLMPSNAFRSFALHSRSNSKRGRVYTGVNDADWKRAGQSKEGHLIYVLTVK